MPELPLGDVGAVIGENEAYEPLPDELVRLIGAEPELPAGDK